MRRKNESIKKGLARHLSDSTAIALATAPIFSAFELYAMRMDVSVSLHSRALGAVLGYGGLATLYSKTMHMSRGAFGLNQESSEVSLQRHDMLFSVGYNLIITPPFYLAVGVHDAKTIAIGTGIAVGMAIFTGGPLGYVVDCYRDLCGIDSSQRLPTVIARQQPRNKKTLAALLVAGSLAITSGLYAYESAKSSEKLNHAEPARSTYFLDQAHKTNF